MTGADSNQPLPNLPGPLDGVRVLEVADEKGEFCGKLMADLGADVIKIEPPGGAVTRSVGPFLEDRPGQERSLSFWHYNTSKRGVTLDLKSGEGQRLFRRLAAASDVVLETFPPGYLESLGLGYRSLAPLNPRLVMCSLTPFGQTGPWRHYRTSDLLHMAAGGQMASSGYDPEDVADAPPIAPGGGNAWHIGGHFAYMGILAALYHRDLTGEGQYVDASIHEACALTTEGAIAIYLSTGEVVLRHTGRHASADQSTKIQLATNDGGWVNLTRSGSNLTPPRLRRLVQWMDEYGLAGDLMDDKYLRRGRGRGPCGPHQRRAHRVLRLAAPGIALARRPREGLPLGRHSYHRRHDRGPPPGGPAVFRRSRAPGTGAHLRLSRGRGHLQRLSMADFPAGAPGGRAQPGGLGR